MSLPRSTNSLAAPIAGNLLFAAKLAMRLYSPQHRARHYNESVGMLSGHRGERADNVVRANGRHEFKL
jgi:hypothetical protein